MVTHDQDSSRCEAYANHGCIVYATARRMEAMAKLDQPTIHKLILDVTKEDQVNEVVKTIIDREGRIDILVNNAGMANPGKLHLSGHGCLECDVSGLI